MNNSDAYIESDYLFGRLRLLYRCLRFGIKSFCSGNLVFLTNSIHSAALTIGYSCKDLFLKKKYCIICGWRGAEFYPNAGPGYFERTTICPQCFCQDRHRTLAYLLNNHTKAFNPEISIIEVAPMRSFQKYCLLQKAQKNYRSFDYSRFAMEQSDLTAMHYSSSCCDYFICMHVLEHIFEEEKALEEIQRVLKPGGTLIIQVPINNTLETTFEYGFADPEDTGHVRQYGKDFPKKMSSAGFKVVEHSISNYLTDADILQGGFDREPIFFCTKSK